MHPAPFAATIDDHETPELLHVDRLSAFYRHHRALSEISLRIPARSVTALIGPTGSGKTTLLRCLCRMHETIEGARVKGSVRLLGRDLYASSQDVLQVRRSVQLVQANPHLFPSMTVRQNLLAGYLLTGHAPEDADALVERCLRQVKLWDELAPRLDEHPTRLRRAVRVRLCIARSLALSPAVLLLDEPSMHLDPVATTQMEELLRALQADITLLVVTQSLQQAARISDYTAYLEHGELIEFDAADRLFTRPTDPRTEDYITGRSG